MGHFSARRINRVKGEANLSPGLKGVFVLLPVNLCWVAETLICGVDGLQGGSSALRPQRSGWFLPQDLCGSSSGLLRCVLHQALMVYRRACQQNKHPGLLKLLQLF